MIGFSWYHLESNQGHMDFQSIALPTELWYPFGVTRRKNGGATWNRTRDTWIFSPLLYQLSYGTLLVLLEEKMVVPPGIEPGTHGFSVHCSTN